MRKTFLVKRRGRPPWRITPWPRCVWKGRCMERRGGRGTQPEHGLLPRPHSYQIKSLLIPILVLTLPRSKIFHGSHSEPLSLTDKPLPHQAPFPSQPILLHFTPTNLDQLLRQRLTLPPLLPLLAFALALSCPWIVSPSPHSHPPDHTKYHLLREAFPDSPLVRQAFLHLRSQSPLFTAERKLTLPTLIIMCIYQVPTVTPWGRCHCCLYWKALSA